MVYCPNLILAQHPAHADKEEGHGDTAHRIAADLGGGGGLVSGGGGEALFLLQRSTLRGQRAAGCPDA